MRGRGRQRAGIINGGRGRDEVVCLRERESENRRCSDRAVCWWSWQLARLRMRASEQPQNLSQRLVALLLMKTWIWTWRRNQAREWGRYIRLAFSDQANITNPGLCDCTLYTATVCAVMQKHICSYTVVAVTLLTSFMIDDLKAQTTVICCLGRRHRWLFFSTSTISLLHG